MQEETLARMWVRKSKAKEKKNERGNADKNSGARGVQDVLVCNKERRGGALSSRQQRPS